MIRTCRAAVGVLVFGALGATVPPQTRDMMEALSRPLASASFQLSFVVLALSAWFWSRAALAARFGINDSYEARQDLATSREATPHRSANRTVYIQLPRLLLGFTGLVALYLTLTTSAPFNGFVVTAWWASGHVWLWMRKRKPGNATETSWPPAAEDMHEVAPTFWRWFCTIIPNVRKLIQYAPLPNWVAYVALALGIVPFILGAIISLLPASPDTPDFVGGFASVMPAASGAVLLLGFMIGPLTVLTVAFDGLNCGFKIAHTEVGFKRPPILIVGLVFVIGVIPYWFPIHNIRTLQQGGSEATMRPQDRSHLTDFNAAWPAACPGGLKHPIIVTMSGGASRAAVWGARVVYAVEEAAGPDGPELRAISSVSGGSLGAAAALSLLARYQDSKGPPCAEPRAEAGRAKKLGLDQLAPPEHPTGSEASVFAQDSLGPLLAGWLLVDLPRTLLSPFVTLATWNHWRPNGGDRAEAIERSFEASWKKLAKGQPNPPKFDLDSSLLRLFYSNGEENDRCGAKAGWRCGMPLWIANGTNASSGNRYLTIPIQPDPQWPFAAASDLLALLQSDVRISTAVNNTARFPFLEPSGDVVPIAPSTKFGEDYGDLIDGGYFENEGLQTAMELAQWLEENDHNVKPIIVVATADGDHEIKSNDIVRCSNPVVPQLSENQGTSGHHAVAQALGPLTGINNVRSGHSMATLNEAARRYCQAKSGGENRFFHFYLPGIKCQDVPLNWVLSDETIREIWQKMDDHDVGNDEEWKALKAALEAAKTDAPPNTPNSH
jgi:hypothetical protein